MKPEPLILLSGIGLVGYLTFHGHPLGKDCWLCPYRGLTFLGSAVSLGVWVAVNEE